MIVSKRNRADLRMLGNSHTLPLLIGGACACCAAEAVVHRGHAVLLSIQIQYRHNIITGKATRKYQIGDLPIAACDDVVCTLNPFEFSLDPR
jgi:hypothetical protein